MLRKKINLFLFIILLLAGFLVRLYRFNNPVADWHSWRQADTSSVSRNFIKYGFDLLHPRMNNISNVQSGFENPKGYFYVEFPLYDAAQAGLYVLFGHLSIEEWGRIITIIMSIAESVFLFLLTRKRNESIGWLVLIFSLFLPYNIYYGRVILPDTSMVAMLIGGIYFFDKWLNNRISNIKWFILSVVFTAVAFILKPYALFYGLPYIVLAWNKFNWKLILKWELWMFAILSATPLVWWRYYMLSYPEGIPANTWLLNGNGIRFRPAFFRWIFYERLAKLISGFFNAIFLVIGLAGIWRDKDKLFFFSFVVSAFVYLCVVATGNVQHDYYQIVVMPSVVILMGYGSFWLMQKLKKLLNTQVSFVIVSVIIGLGFFISWQQVKDYFNINNPAIVKAGQAVNRLTPSSAKILAPYDGDSSFLYQTNRQGWASFEHDLPELIHLGADYLVLLNPTPQDIQLGKQYAIISKTSDYIIFDLHKRL